MDIVSQLLTSITVTTPFGSRSARIIKGKCGVHASHHASCQCIPLDHITIHIIGRQDSWFRSIKTFLTSTKIKLDSRFHFTAHISIIMDHSTRLALADQNPELTKVGSEMLYYFHLKQVYFLKSNYNIAPTR